MFIIKERYYYDLLFLYIIYNFIFLLEYIFLNSILSIVENK